MTQSADVDTQTYQPLADLDERLPAIVRRLRSSKAKEAFDRAIGAVDRLKYKQIQRRHEEDFRSGKITQLNKFLDVPVWLRAHALSAERIGLLSEPARSVLDIGSGGGHFLAICKAQGHRTLGLDVPNELYTQLFQLYGLARIDEGVTFGRAFPSGVGRHDAIVATGVTFDYHWQTKSPNEPKKRWSVEEWAGFLEYLTASHLNFPGLVFLHVNRGGGSKQNPFFGPLFHLLEATGAEVEHDRGRARFLLREPLKFTGVQARWHESASS
jgi:hypothetical protein